jgi:hypothetical protein
MTKNVGQTDKLIRLIIAVVLFLLVYLGKITDGTMQIVVLSAAFIAALTSLINFCPLYKVFKINTCKK